MRTFYEDQCTSMIKSLSLLLRMKYMSNENGRENENIFYIFLNMVPFMRHRGKIIQSRIGHRWHNTAHLIACWIPKATSTHSEWFHERA